MAITATVTYQGWKDASPAGTQTFEKRWRAVSDFPISVESDVALAQIRDATCGEPLKALVPWAITGLNKTLRLRDYQIIPVPGSANTVFEVVAAYRSEYKWADISGGGGSDKLHLPVTIDMTAGERTLQAWRTDGGGVSFALPPSYIYGKSFDIGGERIDDAGKPTMVRVPTIDVRITQTIDVSRTTLVSIYDKISTVRGTWNSQIFLHWNPYEVFCTSATVSPMYDEFYRVSYVFHWDWWKGCSQTPQYDTTGRPVIDGANRTAKFVFWTGLKRSWVNHNIIFDDNTDSALATQIAFEGSFLTYP
jgi:hypothetical protein